MRVRMSNLFSLLAVVIVPGIVLASSVPAPIKSGISLTKEMERIAVKGWGLPKVGAAPK